MSELDSFWERSEQVERFASKEPDHRLQALIERFLDSGGDPSTLRVLDLGCAGGRNAVLLARAGFDVVAVDGSAAMVEETRRRLAEVVGEEEAWRRVRRGSMDDLGWLADGSVTWVVALGIYHNARSRGEWDRALSETARVLAPGGRLLVAVFTPATDLTGEGVRPVPGEPHLYDGFPGGRGFLVEAADLDREMARHGLFPEGDPEVVVKELEVGRRVSVNGLYRRRALAIPSRAATQG